MDWLKWLGDLSPVAIFVVALWVVATKMVTPMLRGHERALQEITAAHAKEAEALTKSIDANTEAVKQSVAHNEKLITNHLSHESEIWTEIKVQLERMNNRRRWTDGDANDK